MLRSISTLLLAALLLSACAWLPTDQDDETQNWSAQRIYTEAKDAIADDNYDKAIQLLEKLEARYPYGPYAQQAQIEVAYAYYKYGEPESAIAAADRFIRLYPTHPHVDYAYYLKGLANFSTKRTFFDRFGGELDFSDRDPEAATQAFEAFRDLITRFPNSRYAEDARHRMTYLLNAMARHDIHVARFYLKRKAYVAAANRAKQVVEKYQDVPAVEDALAIMAEAYQKMGMTDLAADARRVLELNFPKSQHLAELDKAAKAAR
jgi:outer membrane protein assembly factor BamD